MLLKVSGLEQLGSQLDTYVAGEGPTVADGVVGWAPPSGRRRRGSNLSPSNFEGGVAGWDLEDPALGGYPGGTLQGGTVHLELAFTIT